MTQNQEQEKCRHAVRGLSPLGLSALAVIRALEWIPEQCDCEGSGDGDRFCPSCEMPEDCGHGCDCMIAAVLEMAGHTPRRSDAP